MDIELKPTAIREACWTLLQGDHCWWYAQFIHKAIADPKAKQVFPEMPTQYDHDQNPIVYWEGCLYILSYLLGWTCPAKGLAWYYAKGKDVPDSIHIELLSKVYNRNEQLAMLCAWFWRTNLYGQLGQKLLRELSYGGRKDWQWNQDAPADMPSDWWRQFNDDMTNNKWTGWLPYQSTNPSASPLHLGHILEGPGCVDNTQLICGSTQSRRAVLLLDNIYYWYQALSSEGQKLPDIGNHSWKVDVVTKDLGWLGTFRRSRDTGLWFQGKHSIHLQGN